VVVIGHYRFGAEERATPGSQDIDLFKDLKCPDILKQPAQIKWPLKVVAKLNEKGVVKNLFGRE
jgi:hypothetical protein